MIKRFKKYPETYLEESAISCLELLPFSNFITYSNSFNFAWICRGEKNPKFKKKNQLSILSYIIKVYSHVRVTKVPYIISSQKPTSKHRPDNRRLKRQRCCLGFMKFNI